MFFFDSDKLVTKIVVDTGLKDHGYSTPYFHFLWNAGTEWAAVLLRLHLQKKWNEFLAKVRGEAYRQGWADAKAKRAKLH